MPADLRTCLARLWRHPKRDEWLALNQLAFILFGKGGPRESQQAGMLKASSPAYFEDQWRGNRSPVRVRWDAVKRDYPGPPWGTEPTQAPLQQSLDEALIAALEDERRDSSTHWQRHPVFISNLRPLVSEHVDGIAYQADLEDAYEGAGGSLMEGTAVVVKQTNAHGAAYGATQMGATLLLYDPLEWTMILEFEHTPTFGPDEKLAVFPDFSRLIDSFKRYASAFRTHPLCRHLVTGQGDVPAAPPVYLREEGMDPDQIEFLRTAVTHPVTFLWGPPGTGKTFTLAALMVDVALSGERVLGVAISNAAVDELALDVHERLIRLGDEGRLLAERRVMRFGHPGRQLISVAELFPHREAAQQLRREIERLHAELRTERDIARKAGLNQKLKDANERMKKIVDAHLAAARIVLTTIAQCALSDSLRRSGEFGTVVCDEASMANLSHIFPAAMLGRHRLVIAGDPKQLGPVVIATSAIARDYLSPSVFDSRLRGRIHSGIPLVQLKCQRRMAPMICELINNTFYGGTLRSHESVAVPERHLRLPLMSRDWCAMVVRFRGEVEKTAGDSRRNERNARLVGLLLRGIVARVAGLDDQPTIGVITPYRAQVALLRRNVVEIERAHDPRKLGIRVGTVHSFQGGECDIVICDLVDCRPEKPGMLYWNEEGDRLANVAISRARKLLIFVGDDEVFVNHQAVRSLGSILNNLTRDHRVVSAEDLERRLNPARQ